MVNISKLKHHKNIIESFFSLSIINGVNMLLPFVSLPYMLRVIGPSNYGIYTYVYTILQYFSLVVNYGFIYTATKQVAQKRTDSVKINSIYNSVLYSKIILLTLSLLLFIPISHFILETPEKLKQFFWGSGIVIGDLIMPTYLYQGMEKMKYLVIINTIPKLFFTILIFVFIKESADYEYIILFNSLGFILAGIISTCIAYRLFNVKLCRPNLVMIKEQLQEGFSVFASTLGINMYRNSNIIILGLVCSDTIVGIYGAAEKIIKAVQSTITPLTQALFPHIANKLKDLPEKKGIKKIFLTTYYISGILLLISILLLIFSPEITHLILGEKFASAIPLIRIMTIVVFFGGINYILGIIGLIILEKDKQFFYIVLASGIVCILITLRYSPLYTYNAAAWGMSIAELISSIMCAGYLWKLYKKS